MSKFLAGTPPTPPVGKTLYIYIKSENTLQNVSFGFM